ncbi:BTB/POZ domain, partial [Rhizoctonia solani]
MNSPDIYSDMSADGGEHARHGNDSAHLEKSKPDPTGSQFMTDDPSTVDMGHSDIELRVNNTIFKTHKHFLCKFARFEEMIQNMKPHDFSTSTPYITICRDDRGVSDVSNTFKIIYASVIDGPLSFNVPILISALRISSVYGFNNLRAFAIQHLEKMSLVPIQRIQLAREFGLSSWEGPAYKELSDREKAITEEEAQVLGFAAFTKVAREREEAMLKRGKVLGEQEHKGKIKKEQEEKAKKEAEGKAKKAAEEKQRKKLELA